MTIFHKHKWSKWGYYSYSADHYDEEYWKERYCLSCGKIEQITLSRSEYIDEKKALEDEIKGTGN